MEFVGINDPAKQAPLRKCLLRIVLSVLEQKATNNASSSLFESGSTDLLATLKEKIHQPEAAQLAPESLIELIARTKKKALDKEDRECLAVTGEILQQFHARLCRIAGGLAIVESIRREQLTLYTESLRDAAQKASIAPTKKRKRVASVPDADELETALPVAKRRKADPELEEELADKVNGSAEKMTSSELMPAPTAPIAKAKKLRGTLSTVDRKKEDLGYALIKRSDIIMHDTLGTGAFATVYKGVFRGCDIAIKVFSPKASDAMFYAEVKKMGTLRHPNIVQFMGCYHENSDRGLIMERMARGSLFDVIHSSAAFYSLGYIRRLKMAIDAAKAMIYIHKSNIRHCDLNSKNLLVNREWRVKVADLGLSEEVHDDLILGSQTDKRIGTLRWTSPEMMTKRCESMSKADVYSFGLVLFEIATGEVPFPNKTDEDAKKAIVRGEKPKPSTSSVWRKCPGIDKLMYRCLDVDPTSRPDFETICQELVRMRQELKASQDENNPESCSSDEE